MRQAYGGRCPAVMRPATRSGREPGSRFIPAGATGSWAGRGGGPRERILIAAKLGVRGAKGSRANLPATPPIDFQEGCPRPARQNPRLRRYEPCDRGEEPEPAHPNRRGRALPAAYRVAVIAVVAHGRGPIAREITDYGRRGRRRRRYTRQSPATQRREVRRWRGRDPGFVGVVSRSRRDAPFWSASAR